MVIELTPDWDEFVSVLEVGCVVVVVVVIVVVVGTGLISELFMSMALRSPLFILGTSIHCLEQMLPKQHQECCVLRF